MNGLSAEAPPAPSCLPGESGPHGQGWGSPAREGLHQPFQSCWLRSRTGSGASPAVLSSANLSFQQSSSSLVQRQMENKTWLVLAGLLSFSVFSWLLPIFGKRYWLFAPGDNVSYERKSVSVNSSARDPKCLWLGEVLLTLSPGGSNPPWAGQGLSHIHRPGTAPGLWLQC